MALLHLQRASERFRSHLSEEETQRLENVKRVEDVRQAISGMERYLASRQRLRNLERLVPFLDAADRLSKPIDVLTNGVPFLPYIWAPLKLILQISQDHTHALDEILSAYSRIGASLPRLSRYGDTFPDSHDFQQLLGSIYEDIIDFHSHAYRLVQKPGWAMLFSTCWGRFQHRFDSLIDSITRTSELIDKEAASYEIVQAREWRQHLLEEAQDRDKKEEINQREAVMKWLQVSDRNEEKLERLHDRCVEGTSQWVTKSPQVRSWMRRGGGKPVLWLHGKPGSGKSVLCSQLIYFLRSNSNWNCLFFFCDFHTTGYGVTVQVLRSICAQILELVPETVPFMHKACVVSGKKPSASFLKELIPKLASSFEDLRLVIDGIDEVGSSEHGELIKTLTKLAENQESFRLLVSSQDIPSISTNLKGRPTLIVGKQSAFVKKDIDLIVASRLEGISERLDGCVPELVLCGIRKTIQQRAEGMFLWVHLILQVLETSDNIHELTTNVDTFPKDLTEAYNKILTSIVSRCQADDVSKLRRVFGWMVFAKGNQPLRKFELRLGRVLRADSTRVDERTKPFPNVLDICKPFIEDGPDATIVFIHSTVPKFLLAESSGPFIIMKDSCRNITTACIAQLTQSLDLVDEGVGRLKHLYCVGQGFYGLLPYTYEFWIEHLLEYLELDQGLGNPESMGIEQQLIELSEKWRRLVEKEPAPVVSPQSLDPRLHWLESFPETRALIQGALELRKNTKDAVGSDLSPEDAAVHVFTSIRSKYHDYVAELLREPNCPGLEADDLIAFREEYGPSAFVCPVYGCDRSVVGYSSVLRLKNHSSRHQEKLKCFKENCFYNDVGFPSPKHLRDHQRKCHPPPPPPPIPRQILRDPDQTSQMTRTPPLTTEKVAQESTEDILNGPAGPATAIGHALDKDEQMRLMLLEQQNKKRLMMARMEQDSMGGPV